MPHLVHVDVEPLLVQVTQLERVVQSVHDVSLLEVSMAYPLEHAVQVVQSEHAVHPFLPVKQVVTLAWVA